VHHMELVYEFSLRKEAEVQSARQVLWNIVDYAVKERLQSIKAALPDFARNRHLLQPVAESTVARSKVSLNSQSWVQFPALLTPTSVASEPVKKKRKGSNMGLE